ncbi:cystatin domain-containing protein [Thiothrix nivea]|nr:cystatin domain-containing protein [Thiothrix nivea]
MIKYSIVLLVLVFSLSACTDEAVKQPPSAPEAAIAGGYSRITNPDADEELFQVTKFLGSEIGLQTGNTSMGVEKVLEAYRQVVAGINYRVKLQMTDGSQYEAVVYMDLKDEISLTSLEKL